ncbi:type 1 fimbrial protein [Pseudomonas sp. p21]|uniref:type 1 fimbrial protein n=1 Tax=Pseudomonas sp. p21 TaxID=1825979 RepID=UPI0007C86F0E|nr:type 1 fimbrial protein [Pseudomonas sp. p21]
MSGKRFALSAAICLALVGQAQAGAVVASGMLHFTGSIIEPSCTTTVGDAGWRMDNCPALARDSVIGVQGVDGQALPAKAVRVDRGQAYRLVDGRGEPLTQGHYVVVVTSP